MTRMPDRLSLMSKQHQLSMHADVRLPEVRVRGTRLTRTERRLTGAVLRRVTDAPVVPGAFWRDAGYSSASDVLNAATRALEQGQAHRPEATAAAKTCLVDPHPAANGRTDARLGYVQSGD